MRLATFVAVSELIRADNGLIVTHRAWRTQAEFIMTSLLGGRVKWSRGDRRRESDEIIELMESYMEDVMFQMTNPNYGKGEYGHIQDIYESVLGEIDDINEDEDRSDTDLVVSRLEVLFAMSVIRPVVRCDNWPFCRKKGIGIRVR